jgi:hypothetical protein
MSWRKRSGHEHDHIDGRTGIHHIRLENTATGGEHHLQILLGVDACPHCSRPHPKDELGSLDPKAIIADALDMLKANHQAVLDYAAKHDIPVRTSLVTPSIPEGYRILGRGDNQLLVPVKR